MKHLKLYEDFREPKELTTKEEVASWLDTYDVENYTINDDLTVDVDGDVNLWNMGLTSIPVKFRRIKKSFHCRHNNLENLDGLKNLTSVGRDFYCRENNLENLDGLKNLTFVGGWFDCSDNKLINLDGLKNLTSVKGDFYCNTNFLTNLNGLKNLNIISSRVNSFNNFLTKQYFDFPLNSNNPGWLEDDKITIAKNFVDKLMKDKYKEHRDRILDSLKTSDSEIYNIISRYNIESFLERQKKFGGQEEIDL